MGMEWLPSAEQENIKTRYKWDENDYIKIIPSRLVIISRGRTRQRRKNYNHIISNEARWKVLLFADTKLERNKFV